MRNMPDHRGVHFDVGCTVDIENTFENLHAHVELDGNPEIRPGDRVRVHGDPVVVPYGERLTLRRTATVRRAGAFARAWTRMTGDLACFELFEVSFTPEREL